MRKLALIIFLTIGTNGYAQTNARVARSVADLVPRGYVVVQKIKTEELITKLSANSAFPMTDPGRPGMLLWEDSWTEKSGLSNR